MSRFPGFPGRDNGSSSSIRPLSLYSNLTQEEKEYYAYVLNSIFLKTIGNVQASQITPKVARATDFFIIEVLNCSQQMVEVLKNMVLGPIFGRIYEIVTKNLKAYQNLPIIRQFIIDKIAEEAFDALIDQIFKHRIFAGCVSAVNVRWKSQIGLLLGGIIDDLPY